MASTLERELVFNNFPMRFHEVRVFLTEMMEVYDPVTRARKGQRRKPLFPQPDDSAEQSPPPSLSLGSRPATRGEIYHALRHTHEDSAE